MQPTAAPVTIIRNAEVFAPEPLGYRDVVIAGERITAVTVPNAVHVQGLPVLEHDASGAMLTPGFIDNHVHVLGGGGGLGFASRAPELQMSQLTRVGTTTVIGMLGFDATTKSMAALVAKTKAFREDGISAYALTGATLEHPVPTLTGRIRTDIVFVEEIIGVGEISVSEMGYGYDSLGQGAQYIAEAATEALLAGRLAGKRGFLCLQVPPYGGSCLKPLFEMLDKTGLPMGQLIPSHVNQSPAYMEDALQWGQRGGWIDIGANYTPDNGYDRAMSPTRGVRRLLEGGVPANRILLSTDGNGAPPREESREGQPARASYMPVGALHAAYRELVLTGELTPDLALAAVTSNVATATGLVRKGRIAPDMDADLVLFDNDWDIRHVWARGRKMVEDGDPVQRGRFDKVLLDELS